MSSTAIHVFRCAVQLYNIGQTFIQLSDNFSNNSLSSSSLFFAQLNVSKGERCLAYYFSLKICYYVEVFCFVVAPRVLETLPITLIWIMNSDHARESHHAVTSSMRLHSKKWQASINRNVHSSFVIVETLIQLMQTVWLTQTSYWVLLKWLLFQWSVFTVLYPAFQVIADNWLSARFQASQASCYK